MTESERELDLLCANLMDENAKLREAAIALIKHWNSPLWKDAPHTGEYIHKLMVAAGFRL